MANADAAFGLRPLGYDVDKQTNVYAVDATNAIYIGDPVSLTGTGDTEGVPQVKLAVISDATTTNNTPIMGVVVGVCSDRNGSSLQDDAKYVAASATGKYVRVVDDPDALFVVQEDSGGAALAVTAIGQNANLEIAAGSATSGLSGTEIDSSKIGTDTAFSVKILGLYQTPDNAVGDNAVWKVQIANHQLRAATAGV